jgi:DNA gyrase subunit A
MALRFDGKNVSVSSRTAIGVKAINLNDGDIVADALYLSGEKSIMIFAANGMAKRVPVTDFVIQNRAGKGLICHKAGNVVAACPVNEDNMILVVGDTSTICVSAADVTEGSRSAQGVMAIKGNNIIGVARI